MLKHYPHEILRGERIELRKHELALAKEMFRLVDSDRVRLARFLPWVAGMHSIADEEEYVRFAHVQWDDYKLFDYGIFFEGRFVGNCGAHTVAWEHERAEIGYWLAGAFEGRGLMTEAVGLLEAELFRIGFHRLEIHCDPHNVRSAAVPQRRGYALEATLKDHKVEEGRRRDTLIWAKLRT
ncbi:MAG: GNAT family N-acetyltransferase [Bdellovibrionota bacterium]